MRALTSTSSKEWVMSGVLRCSLLIAVLTLGSACGPEQPSAPSGVPARPIITQAPTPPPQPAGQPVATYFSASTPLPRQRFHEQIAIPLVRERSVRAAIRHVRARVPGHISTGRGNHQLLVRWPRRRDGDFQGDLLAIVYTELAHAAVGLRECCLPATAVVGASRQSGCRDSVRRSVGALSECGGWE